MGLFARFAHTESAGITHSTEREGADGSRLLYLHYSLRRVAEVVYRRRTARAGGVRISWLDWSGRGFPVLAIHGITANARAFDGLARAVGTGHRIIAMDLRGRGESDAPSGGYDVETHASDALAVIGAAGVDRCSVVGWSLGGRIALAMAALHPARISRVIALDPPLVTREATRAVLRGFWTRLTATYPSVDAYVERMADAALFGGRNAIVEAYLRADVRRDANGVVRHRVNPRVPELELTAEDRLPTAAYLAAVRCPVLIVRSTGPISASGDAVLPAEDARVLVAELADARLLDLVDANHFSMLLGEPPPVTPSIVDFLAEGE